MEHLSLKHAAVLIRISFFLMEAYEEMIRESRDFGCKMWSVDGGHY